MFETKVGDFDEYNCLETGELKLRLRRLSWLESIEKSTVFPETVTVNVLPMVMFS